MKEILIGIVALIVAIAVLRIIGRLLVRFVYEPLDRLCNRRGYSTNPIPLGIWTVLLLYEYTSKAVYDMLLTQWKWTMWLTPEIYPWIILGLLAIPYVVLLIKTKVIYFIPVLLAKILIYPMALIAILCGYETESGKIPINDIGHIPSSGRRYPSPSGSESSFRYADDDSSGSNGTPDYLAEKYRDQYRESQGGEGYSSVEVGKQSAYFQGDYVPFGAEGEQRTYDSDVSPMD